jgi:hypothetical protein
MEIKLYNGLTPQIKDHNDDDDDDNQQVDSAVLDFLHQHTFYKRDIYFDHQ